MQKVFLVLFVHKKNDGRRLAGGSHWMRAVCGGGITSPILY
ncbi:MAG: hypothetical protein R3Y61_03485 [Rikenellaceae bacterium]